MSAVVVGSVRMVESNVDRTKDELKARAAIFSTRKVVAAIPTHPQNPRRFFVGTAERSWVTARYPGSGIVAASSKSSCGFTRKKYLHARTRNESAPTTMRPQATT